MDGVFGAAICSYLSVSTNKFRFSYKIFVPTSLLINNAAKISLVATVFGLKLIHPDLFDYIVIISENQIIIGDDFR